MIWDLFVSSLSLFDLVYIWKQFRTSQCFYLDTSYVFWIIVLHQYNMYVYHIQYHKCSKKLCQGPRCSQLIPGYLKIYKTEMFILRDVPLVKYILLVIRILEKSFFKENLFAYHRFNIKTWLKWCTFDAPPDDSSPPPHFLNHLRKQSVEIIFSTSVLAQTVGKGIECYCLIGVHWIQPKETLLQQTKRILEKF